MNQKFLKEVLHYTRVSPTPQTNLASIVMPFHADEIHIQSAAERVSHDPINFDDEGTDTTLSKMCQTQIVASGRLCLG